MKWEQVVDGTFRLQIFGGWLVLVRDSCSDREMLTFVPDPKHEWKLEEVNSNGQA